MMYKENDHGRPQFGKRINKHSPRLSAPCILLNLKYQAPRVLIRGFIVSQFSFLMRDNGNALLVKFLHVPLALFKEQLATKYCKHFQADKSAHEPIHSYQNLSF